MTTTPLADSAPRAWFDLSALARVFDDSDGALRTRIVGMYAVLLAVNAAAWVAALTVFAAHPLLVGNAILAYSFGLRHAVDADHICAIDNVTRKLMQEKKRPVAVGFFFSLGHSTIVVALTLAIALAAATIQHSFPNLERAGAFVGTSVSAAFLYAIAAINLAVLIGVYRTFRRVSRGEPYDQAQLDEALLQRGVLGRLFRPLLRAVGKSWHMYPLGVLFGLGFDTATEVGLLGIAAIEAGKGLPIWAILIFPLLFTAGMSLLDTTDGILMLGAYGWAFVRPVRKLFYNMSVTCVSVAVAFLVGSIELAGVVASQFNATDPVSRFVGRLNDNFGMLGFAIVALFALTWATSAVVYKLRRYDQLERVVTPGR
jgi:high-affinity nickel-transport protein